VFVLVIVACVIVCVACGIPDFRSPGTGLYDSIADFDLPSPQAVFDIGYFRVGICLVLLTVVINELRSDFEKKNYFVINLMLINIFVILICKVFNTKCL